jgi:hypothetical protein
MSVYLCQVSDCCKQFFSAKSLLCHMALMHSENKRLNLVCHIDGCSYFYNTVETFRKHIRLTHAMHWDPLSSQEVVTQPDSELNSLLDTNTSDTAATSCSANVTHQHWVTFLNDFAKHAALMKLKITESYKLSKSVSYSILQDVKTLFDVYQKNLVDLIKLRLQSLGVVVSEDPILTEVLSCDSLFDIVQSKFATEHLFNKYLLDNLKLMSPVAVNVKSSVEQAFEKNSEQATEFAGTESVVNEELQYHYVPILDTLKNYLEQPDVWASCQLQPNPNPVLQSFTDGSIYSSCEHARNANFIRIHLYSDEAEICNPIGSRKTVHKLSVFYFLVGNTETKHWSKLSNIHLALLCKFKSVKTMGYKKLLEPLLADIKILEKEGLVVEIDGAQRRLFGTIVTVAGDNLTSHTLGGFQSCFTSGRVCRYCMATKLSLTEIHSEAGCTLRTYEAHMYHLEAIQGNKDLAAVYGVVRARPFSELALFNPVTFFPPDVMHEVLEGLMVVNVGVVLNRLVQGKILSIKQFNDRLASLKFGSAESDKFGPLPLDFVNKHKHISGKAAEKLCLFRLLPLLVADLVPEGADYWRLHLLCRQICEIVLAPKVDPDWLPYLEVVISQHHRLLADIAPKSFTPKVHFVTHYPRLILAYGSLRHLWVMRFEAVHQYFKQITRNVRSFKNITQTLANRFQMKKCYELAANVFLLSATVVQGVQREVKVECLPADLIELLREPSGVHLKPYDVVLSAKSVDIDSHRFRVGCYIVFDVDVEEIPVFMLIKHLLSVNGMWFICGNIVSVSHFASNLHAYALKQPGSWVVLQPKQNIDCQCLSSYKFDNEEYILLKHRVIRQHSNVPVSMYT